MKVWILAGLFTVAMAPFAAASESTVECQLDDTRRAAAPRTDAPAPPAPSAVRPTAAPRVAAEQAPRPEAPRRRGGKRIPDAELIGPRGAL
jgi:hypothetical protein